LADESALPHLHSASASKEGELVDQQATSSSPLMNLIRVERGRGIRTWL